MLAIPSFSGPLRRIGPAGIAVTGEREAMALLGEIIGTAGHLKVAFANAHFVNEAARNPAFRSILPQFMILPDGIGVDIASKLLYGEKFPANLNGTDFVPAFLQAQAAPLRVALLGAKPGVADKAAQRLSRMTPQHDIHVISHGYFTPEEEVRLLDQLAAAPADLLLVAFGNPAQEKWIARCITPAHARIAMGVGALLDFLAGEVPRAPEAVRRLRLEWMWRLAQEPRRLWRRYILGNPAFLLRVLRQKYFSAAEN